MGVSTFEKVGDANTILGSESPETELRKILEEAQRTNDSWATQTLKDIRSDGKLKLIDSVLVNEKGRVVEMWPTFASYVGFPNTTPPPTASELVSMVRDSGELLYPLNSRNYVQIFSRRQAAHNVLSIVGDAEMYPYGPIPNIGLARDSDFRLIYAEDEKLTPAKAKSIGIALGNLGIWATSEAHDNPRGDPERIVSYKPRVYMGHGVHPLRREIYITPNPRAMTVATGHVPMDRRADNAEVRFLE